MLTNIHTLVEDQRRYFQTGITKDLAFRIAMLKKLREAIVKNEANILKAVYEDLHKPKFEAYTSEIMPVLHDIDLCIKNLRRWSKPVKARTPLILFKAQSQVYYEPYGVTLIIGTWNYPFHLTFIPLIGALVAGNCAIIKTSEIATASSVVMAEIIRNTFATEYCSVVEGAVEETTALLNEKFDLIFFTGSPRIAKIIAQEASKQLIPTVLELGGKNPCIVDKTADIAIAARRIAWGKYLNAGQICVSPDYLIVHTDVKEALLAQISKCVKEFYGETPENSPDFSRIVNEKNFDRLVSLMNHGKIVLGGKTDKTQLYIAPTIIDNITWDDPIMQQEIFGPLLPVMEYTNLSDVISMINAHEKPLALYFFSKNRKEIKRVIHSTSSGSVGINATVLHIGNPYLPFGGVGNSGMGNYHSRYSFETFSHKKSILDKSYRIDLALTYPPYQNNLQLVKRIFSR